MNEKIIVNYLKDMQIIESDENGGFHFIGNDSDKNKKIYLNAFQTF